MPRRTDGAPAKAQRHRSILAALATDPTVRISSLATSFGVSSETVRRDIEELSRQGAVRRTYGGASVVQAALQPELSSRERMAVAERARIGAAAAALVEPGDVVMLDAGSTTSHFARALVARGSAATVLTNTLPGAGDLAAAPAGLLRVVLCPGEVSAAERGVYGSETEAFLRRFNADLAVIGASGLTEEGPCEAVSRAAWVKRAMLGRAPRRMLLADSGKFGRGLLECVCPLGELTDLVTEAPPPPGLAAALGRAGMAVTLADDAS
ncbi:DeoR/GlpR family DNA-binding transcription regulator [Falsiroseomonas sp.]|uniref:DeoR/GlpR family DNA-binding transcription regulator n=1 Tax=Falsiroseomonas sp. TaxID=2870721 RepID=UPI003569FF2E